MASEPLTQEQRARLENVARLYPFVRFRNDDLRAALAHIDAVTAERDRLWKALEYVLSSPFHPDSVRTYLVNALAAATPPTGHTHPRPCSICRREDCTTEHACE